MEWGFPLLFGRLVLLRIFLRQFYCFCIQPAGIPNIFHLIGLPHSSQCWLCPMYISCNWASYKGPTSDLTSRRVVDMWIYVEDTSQPWVHPLIHSTNDSQPRKVGVSIAVVFCKPAFRTFAIASLASFPLSISLSLRPSLSVSPTPIRAILLVDFGKTGASSVRTYFNLVF